MESVFEDSSRQMLATLRTRLLVMFAHVGIALDESGKALAQDDAARALAVQEGDAVIDDLENEIDELCLRVMARLQPVAGDLRFVVAALRMVVDLERIGDEAAAIAERVLLLHELPINEEDMRRLREMFAQARAAYAQASDAFREEDAQAALNLRADEDEEVTVFSTGEPSLAPCLQTGCPSANDGMATASIIMYKFVNICLIFYIVFIGRIRTACK